MFTARTPADVAVAGALLSFADSVAACAEGVVADTDPEFLHDLRVAVRRSRSLVKSARDVLPEPFTLRYGAELTWLGRLTGPVRDLDVYLAGSEDLTNSLMAGEPSDLEPFVDFLRREREHAHRELVRALRSDRFTSLLRHRHDDPAAPAEASESSVEELAVGNPLGFLARLGSGRVAGDSTRIGDFAADRLRRLMERVFRRAASITADSPSERIHDLRKRCKELRYLVEFVRPLCTGKSHRVVVKDLKRLQDVLGAFQDGEVQTAILRSAAERMQRGDPPPAATLLAMGEISAHYVTRQRRTRYEIVAVLPRFLDTRTRARIDNLLP